MSRILLHIGFYVTVYLNTNDALLNYVMNNMMMVPVRTHVGESGTL